MSEQDSINALVYGRDVTIHQGENAVNIINIINNQNENNSDADTNEDNGKSESSKDADKGDTDTNSEEKDEFPLEKVIDAMDDIAEMQLCEASPLRTLIYILDKYIKLGNEVGFLKTRQKIDALVLTMQSTDCAFLLATEYMKRGKEFEAMIICKHLVSWLKRDAEMGGDAKVCIQRMTEEYMSLARDAAMKISRSTSREKEIYKDYLVPIMYEIFLDIEEVQCEEISTKTCFETLSAYYVACVHFSLEEWSEMYAVCNKVIVKMQQRCGKDAEKRLAYGDVLFMAAMAKYRMEDLQEAEKLWQQAIEAFEVEGKNNNNNQGESNVTLTTQWLMIVREKLQENTRSIVEKISQ